MKKIVFTLIIICLFITPVSAYQMALTGNNDIDNSLDVSLAITDFKEHDSFYGLTANLGYDEEKLELLEIIGDNNFGLTYSAKTKRIVLYNTTGTNEKVSIISFKFKNIGLNKEEETEIKVDNIIATDSNKDIKVDSVAKMIKAVSVGNKSDNYLIDIKINGKSLDFDKNELNYEIVVSHDTTEIDVSSFADGDNTIVGNGTYQLDEGNNEIKLVVKDKNNEERTYIVNVNREDSNSDINEEDLFIKTEKFKWNNLYFIPIGVVLVLITILIIKRKGVK